MEMTGQEERWVKDGIDSTKPLAGVKGKGEGSIKDTI